jgi:hypothetical protein
MTEYPPTVVDRLLPIGTCLLVLGGVTVVGYLVVPALHQKDVDFWNRRLAPSARSLDVSAARRHLSTVGRARIEKILRDRPDSIAPEVRRELHRLGFTPPPRPRRR